MNEEAGIKRITIKAEPEGQMSSLMIAYRLRRLADDIEQENGIYDHAIVITWFPEFS